VRDYFQCVGCLKLSILLTTKALISITRLTRLIAAKSVFVIKLVVLAARIFGYLPVLKRLDFVGFGPFIEICNLEY